MKTKREKRLERLALGAAEAIKNATQKWYADCYNLERDMIRMMLWENKIRRELNKEL